jgi:hypothetical protein
MGMAFGLFSKDFKDHGDRHSTIAVDSEFEGTTWLNLERVDANRDRRVGIGQSEIFGEREFRARGQSERSASIGSIRLARRAGT